MPKFGRPLGTLINHPPEWFWNNMAIAGYTQVYSNPGGDIWFFAIGLYNNDTLGRVLRVYGITSSLDGGEGLWLYKTQSTLGTIGGFNSAMRFDQGMMPGVITYNLKTRPVGTVEPYVFPNQVGFLGSFGYDGMNQFNPYPLFIIPPGYCLIGANGSECASPGVCFWYQVSNV